MQHYKIASMMICDLPRRKNDKFILSAYDGVWEPILKIPNEVSDMLTDDIGNSDPVYAGNLQMKDPNALQILDEKEYFCCFRGIDRDLIKYLGVSPADSAYESIESSLELVGYDLCSGNGWISASCHGIFPTAPTCTNTQERFKSSTNNFSLIEDLHSCEQYKYTNDLEIPEHAPWYPVAVYISRVSVSRLVKFNGRQKPLLNPL